MIRIVRTLGLGCLCLAATCGLPDDPSVDFFRPPSLNGTFDLHSVDGNSLPAIISVTNGDTVRVTSETLAFQQAPTFLRTRVEDHAAAGQHTIEVHATVTGVYELDDSTVKLAFDGTTVAARLTLDSLIMTRDALVYLYLRRR